MIDPGNGKVCTGGKCISSMAGRVINVRMLPDVHESHLELGASLAGLLQNLINDSRPYLRKASGTRELVDS